MKLHPVEVMWTAARRNERASNSYALGPNQDHDGRICRRLWGWNLGYIDGFRGQNNSLLCEGDLAGEQGYRAGQRAAERWLAGCPVRELRPHCDEGSYGGQCLVYPGREGSDENVPLSEGTYRLERIGD